MGVAVIGERAGLELLLGLGEDWLVVCVVVAAVAGALRSAHFANREALAIHLDAIGLLAGTSSLFLSIRSRLFILLLSRPLHYAQSQRILLTVVNQLASGLLVVRFIEAGEGECGGL